MIYTPAQIEKIKELKTIDVESSFNEFLDEQGDVEILGMSYLKSTILKEVDPVAFRCCLADYVDGQEVEEIDGEYYSSEDISDALEELKNEEEL